MIIKTIDLVVANQPEKLVLPERLAKYFEGQTYRSWAEVQEQMTKWMTVV